MIKILVLSCFCSLSAIAQQSDYIVKIISNDKADNLFSEYKFKPVFPKLNLYKVSLSVENAAFLQKKQEVLYVVKDRKLTQRSNSWAVKPEKEKTYNWAHERIKLEDAWKYTQGGTTPDGKTIVVATLDDGLDLNHNNLKTNIFHNESEIANNGTDDDGNGYTDDYHGWNVYTNTDQQPKTNHGTSVAGIIGGYAGNGYDAVGISPTVKILPVSLTNYTESEALEGYAYILNMRELYDNSGGQKGAYIVASNASFGIDRAFPSDFPDWCAVFDVLGQHGILSVAATANDYLNVDNSGDMPTGCSSDYLISVTASNIADIKVFDAGFSSVSIDLAAPGETILSTVTDHDFANFDGTSAASPHVTGTVALLYAMPVAAWSNLMNSNPAQAALLAKQMILDGTDKKSELSTQTLSGGRLSVGGAVNKLLEHFEVKTELESNYIFPNPSGTQSGTLWRVNTPVPGDYELKIFSPSGQLVSKSMVKVASIGSVDIPINFISGEKGFFTLLLNKDKICVSDKVLRF